MFNISYNVGNKHTLSETDFRTVGEVMNSTALQTKVGFDPSQVTPFVNGVEADYNDIIVANMSLRLVKKAGSKSDGEGFMNKDEQLAAIGVNATTRNLVIVCMATAMAPLYKKLSAAENKAEKDLIAAQRAKIVKLDAFETLNDRIIDSIVKSGYVTGLEFEIPAGVNDELRRLAKDSEKSLETLRNATAEAESATNEWKNSVLADLELCVTIAQQRSVLAKAQAGDPLKPWVIVDLGA